MFVQRDLFILFKLFQHHLLRLTLGAAYRFDAAYSALMGFQLTDQLLIGYAFDKETTNWGRFNDGSHEFFLRYEFKTKHNRTISPRFF
jgi:hypothetical protein